MGFYYVELDDYQDKDYHVISYGGGVGIGDLRATALRHTNGLIVEITQEEHDLLSACKGNVQNGIRKLHDLQNKIDAKINENE